MKLSKLYGIKIIMALVIGLLVGSLSFGFTNAIADDSSHNAKIPEIKVNKNGQTYGSRMGATSPEQEPDLILAKGVDGTVGYVKKVDLIGEEPKTPEEAIALQDKRIKEGARKIPLYDANGENIIGEFKISPPNGQKVTAEE